MLNKKDKNLDVILLALGILALMLIKNSTRFLGVGLISLSLTYFFIDGAIKMNTRKHNKIS
ncbi:hypothetical protein [Inconstantimicrobium mannanitabidum]|uniref:Uncharacterized protein n=1 Tax=Inconstantimicrobium mannanitabidum TaxID=1604901 RepID=A0ACB5RG75_9CLOT|nr:hypothetical protein [Clostridium sp. TW13]GKX68089.1 hypothetical protein rsdtw13_33470 [Clostridium sp. TW13]